ncbi:unnamed protein product [Soboliphyme baturini]|uniref:Uncharacterized protein n=1 Tax=Soboliphyme baturini TaxID=241478 RepID=A0A183J906_9BILA|nr:unnamed protein product [Soboliphyme baturini]
MLEKVLNQTAVKNSDFFAIAKSHLAALKCHRKLEIALEAQHENLKQVLTELQSYQLRLKNLQRVNEESFRYIVDADVRKSSQLLYNYFTYGPVEGLECNVVGQGGRTPHINCAITSLAYYKALHKKVVEEKNFLLTLNQTSQLASEKPRYANWQHKSPFGDDQPIAIDFDKEKRFLNALAPLRNLQLNEPTKPKLFPRSHTDAAELAQRFWDNNSWPSVNECKELENFKVDPLDSFFLSPENKGFE